MRPILHAFDKGSNQGWAGNDLSAFPFLAFAVAGNGRFFWLPVEQNFGCRQQNCCRSLLILVSGNRNFADYMKNPFLFLPETGKDQRNVFAFAVAPFCRFSEHFLERVARGIRTGVT